MQQSFPCHDVIMSSEIWQVIIHHKNYAHGTCFIVVESISVGILHWHWYKQSYDCLSVEERTPRICVNISNEPTVLEDMIHKKWRSSSHLNGRHIIDYLNFKSKPPFHVYGFPLNKWHPWHCLIYIMGNLLHEKILDHVDTRHSDDLIFLWYSMLWTRNPYQFHRHPFSQLLQMYQQKLMMDHQ